MSDDETSEIELGPSIEILRAPSARAQCKSARCVFDDRTMDEKIEGAGGKSVKNYRSKIKGAKIDKDQLKIQKKQTIAAFGDHEMISNFHLPCFFVEETHKKATTQIVHSSKELSGFDSLPKADQKLVETMIERCKNLWNRWKAHNTRRTFSENEVQEREDEVEDWRTMTEGGKIKERHYDFDADDQKAAVKKAAAKRKKKDDDEEDSEEEDEKPKKKRAPAKPKPAKAKKATDEDEDEDDYDNESDEVEAKKPSKAAAKMQTSDDYDTSGYELDQVSDPKAKAKEAYAKLMSRPSTLGLTKEIPEGAANCLAGLAFVISGVLDSLTMDEAKQLIEKYGGRVTGAVSNKTSYLLRGAQAGESKTRDARAKGVEIIDEDGLLHLIETRPSSTAAAAKPAAKKGKAKTKAKKGASGDDEDEVEDEAPKVVAPKKSGGRSMPTFLRS